MSRQRAPLSVAAMQGPVALHSCYESHKVVGANHEVRRLAGYTRDFLNVGERSPTQLFGWARGAPLAEYLA
ncbi:MAG TPA: hypothetical protein VGP70_26540, partial [Actinomadura sp.]|nr:hypothetical protein [Actinomadura sp.]